MGDSSPRRYPIIKGNGPLPDGVISRNTTHRVSRRATQPGTKPIALPAATQVSDPGLRTSRQYGLVYQLPPVLLRVYHQLGIDLEQLNGTTGADLLPLAATFVINRDRCIVCAEINENHTQRLDPVDIIAELVELSTK